MIKRTFKTIHSAFPEYPVRSLLLLALLVHLLSAWFNRGHFHPDEYFQILEFAGFKLGKTPLQDLPWEFQARIRPALQPALAWLSAKSLLAAGVSDPFTHTFLLRLLSALLGLYVAFKLFSLTSSWISSKNLKKYFLLLSLFYWYLPFLHNRFNSENWSAIFLLLGIFLAWDLFKNQDNVQSVAISKLMLSGFFFGCAFYFRFQIGFALLGVGLWLVVFKKNLLKILFPMASGFLVAVAMNIFLEHWLYGEWTFSPLNYFSANIIQGKAAGWGTSPWWFYFYRFLISNLPPFSIFMLFAIFLGVIRKPRNIFVWILVPFWLAHIIVGHKEMRFMFPMIYLLPLFLVLPFDFSQYRLDRKIRYWIVSPSGKISLKFFWTFNIIFLVIFTLKPAHESATIYHWLYKQGNKQKTTLYTLTQSPYFLAGLKINYLKSPNVAVRKVNDLKELKQVIASGNHSVYFFYEGKTLPGKLVQKGFKLKMECSSIPPFLFKFNINNWLSRVKIWSIYKMSVH